jgi:hypothetical protein
MPEAIGILLIGTLAPDLAAAASVPLSLGGISLGITGAGLVGSATILGCPVGAACVLSPADDENQE